MCTRYLVRMEDIYINFDGYYTSHKVDSAPEPKYVSTAKLKPAMPEIGRDLCRIKRIKGECAYIYGYRQDILTENLTEREKDILICTVCNGIMREPCISKRGEQFCSYCYAHAKQTPNLTIRKMISLLKCSCPLIERGCKWLGTLEDCENHLDTCGYVYETCKLNCGEVLRREELKGHEKENCLERQVKCDHCDENFISRELDGHLEKCPKTKVVCILVGCGTKITREDMELHLEYYCGMVQETCKLGCGVELTRNELRIHEKENCPQRFVKCDHCNENFKSRELDEHLQKCPKMKVSCDLLGCDTKITREEMELHLKHDCGMVKETCKLGCGMELTRIELVIHEKDNCINRIIRCEHCSIEVIFSDNSKHLKECPLLKVTCYQCSVEKYRKDMTQHSEDDCPENKLDCPFVKYKCLSRIKRKDIDKHLEEKETKHLGLKLNAMEDLINKQSEIINKQSKVIDKLNENNDKQNKEITKQREEMTREISNTSKQIELIYFITDTTKII